MQHLLILLVFLTFSSAELYTDTQGYKDTKVALAKYCTRMCEDKCVVTKLGDGTLTCAVPPCPELPCDSDCFGRCTFAKKFLPHWLT